MDLTIIDEASRYSQRVQQYIRTIRRRNICGICHLHFVTRADLNGHMQQHAVTYKCDCCNVICDTWLNFQNHWLTHEPMVFCPYCYKAHRNYWRLSLHWRMHGKKISLCPYCDKEWPFFKSNVLYIV